jgi:hypothetical protein
MPCPQFNLEQNQEPFKPQTENPPQPPLQPNPAYAQQPAILQDFRKKRRSKNDNNGRDYVCGCGKTYLSYPALYTHIKTKHNGENPCGTQQFQSGRGRGRPKKIIPCGQPEVEQNQLFPSPSQHLVPGLNYAASPKEEEKVRQNNENDPDSIFTKYGVLEYSMKNPTNVFTEFLKQTKPEHVQYYNDLLDNVKAVYQEETQKNQIASTPDTPFPPPIFLNKDDLNNEQKSPVVEISEKKCERILSEYLCEMVNKVNEKFFTSLIIFARLYRDYMNVNGWDIIGVYKPVSSEDRMKEYSKHNNTEHFPEACNSFVKQYLPKEYPNFEQPIAIDLTIHMCDWMYKKGYTHTKISKFN